MPSEDDYQYETAKKTWGYISHTRNRRFMQFSSMRCARYFLYLQLSKTLFMDLRYFDEINSAVTVCDTEGVVLYQNEKSVTVNGDVRGKSMIPCHNERSREIIRRLVGEGGTNVYTIEKKGVHKLIYQTAWREDGVVKGLVEFSIETPAEMPHYVR